MSKPWGSTKKKTNADTSRALEMSDWLAAEMLRGHADGVAREPQDLKERAAELYAQLHSTEDA